VQAAIRRAGYDVIILSNRPEPNGAAGSTGLDLGEKSPPQCP
jgi:hypothetical protein